MRRLVNKGLGRRYFGPGLFVGSPRVGIPMTELQICGFPSRRPVGPTLRVLRMRRDKLVPYTPSRHILKAHAAPTKVPPSPIESLQFRRRACRRLPSQLGRSGTHQYFRTVALLPVPSIHSSINHPSATFCGKSVGGRVKTQPIICESKDRAGGQRLTCAFGRPHSEKRKIKPLFRRSPLVLAASI